MSQRLFARVALTLVFCLTVLMPGMANAQERITSYDIDILVEGNGDLLVTEIIRVIAEHNKINRGIFRDFPRQYQRPLGFYQYVDFDVERVTRDGRDEPYFIESDHGFDRLYIGDADTRISQGQHTYEITYRTREQLGFSSAGTELYWNLIGTEWDFPVDRVNAVIRLPQGANVSDLSTYTGVAGSRGSSARAFDRGNRVRVENRRPMAPGEGLTVSLVWQNGLVEPVGALSNALDVVQDNLGFFIGLIAVFGVGFYFERIWRRYGQDPETGVIIPLFEPPKGLSPVALGYIHSLGFKEGVSGGRALTVAITSLAIKGHLTVDETGSGYQIHLADKNMDDLPPGEALLLARLKAHAIDDTITLDGTYDSNFQAIKKAYMAIVEKEYTEAYFRTNGGKWFAGAAIAALALIATTALNQPFGQFMIIACIPTVFFGIAFSFLMASARSIWLKWQNLQTSTSLLSVFGAVLLFIVAAAVSAGLGLGVIFLAGAPVLVIAMLLVGISTCFLWLMEAPTIYGRQIMDKIEGYKLFLTTTEWDRMKARGSMPKPDAALFEKHLAYSMALGVDEAWSRTLAKYAAAAALPPVQYYPAWYHSTSGGMPSFSTFSSDFSSGMNSSFASASSPPSSSSGSGGGGFSGGGGGGGGGGGW